VSSVLDELSVSQHDSRGQVCRQLRVPVERLLGDPERELSLDVWRMGDLLPLLPRPLAKLRWPPADQPDSVADARGDHLANLRLDVCVLFVVDELLRDARPASERTSCCSRRSPSPANGAGS
jgi:hypothetical protein